MNLLTIRVLAGKNIYAHFPIVRLDVDLGKYVDVASCEIDSFNENLLDILPGLAEHRCGGHTKGFIKRLERGTYFAHIIEHIALEIQKLLGYDISFGKARYLQEDTIYYIVYGYEHEVAGIEAGRLAFSIVNSLIHRKTINLDKKLENIREKIYDKELGPSTSAIVTEARKRGIPVMRIGDKSLLQLGYGKPSRRIKATIADTTSCIAVDIACDKELTNSILRSRGIPVPMGRATDNYNEAIKIVEEIGFPVAIKPYNGNQGRGVSLNLQSWKEVKIAFDIAKKFSHRILIEEYLRGKHYRVTVINGLVAAVAERIAAHVVGNGENTIEELIEMENKNPLRGIDHEKPLTKIKIDDVMMLLLDKTGRKLSDIPHKGELVFLRENDNLSTGGIAIDYTDEIHPHNAKLAIDTVEAIGLDIAGVDITTKDIGKPIESEGGGIIEVNACPGIRMHHYPFKGKTRNVAGKIVETLFPEGKDHSVPIISVTGTNGKTTTCRMISKILREQGLVVGMTSTGGIYIQDERIIKGDTTGPRSAQTVLMDKRIEVAVLETARGGIVNKGLGYEYANIGVVTNISDDHLGIDGINSLEEMAYIKSLIVETVDKQGYAILNADNEYVAKMARRVKCKVIYFSQNFSNPILIEHIQKGGKAVYIRDAILHIFNGRDHIPVIKTKELPATLGGILEHNIENSMAALAVTHGLGIEIEIIRKALSQFYTDTISNPGRCNIFDMGKFKVVLDYGHNIEGYNKVLEGLKEIKENRLVGVIGMPGDRSDISILKVGEIAGKYFDYSYIKEDRLLRGRKAGEVATLLRNGCSLGGLEDNCMEIELCEEKALKKAIENAEEGDCIIVFYEEYEPLLRIIESHKKCKEKLEDRKGQLDMKNEIAQVGP